MPNQNLIITDQNHIRTICINRPDKLNALNHQTITELQAAFLNAQREANIRVIILTGSGGKAFVAGADITELNVLTPTQALEFSRIGQQLMTLIERLGKPVIAKINGFALGGGMEIAMACSLRIASQNAKFGQPEINLGIIPGFGGTQRLLRLAGRATTLELCLLGQPITAERAYALNIITQLVEVEQLDATVNAIAQQLANSAPHAIRGVLDAVLIGGEASIDMGLDYESQAFAVCISTEDMREGTAAFLEKRKPSFTGK